MDLDSDVFTEENLGRKNQTKRTKNQHHHDQRKEPVIVQETNYHLLKGIVADDMASVSTTSTLAKTTTTNVANNYVESKGNSQPVEDYVDAATSPTEISKLVCMAI